MKYLVIFFLLVVICAATYLFGGPQNQIVIENTFSKLADIVISIVDIIVSLASFLIGLSLATWVMMGVIFLALVISIALAISNTDFFLAVIVFTVAGYAIWHLGLSIDGFTLNNDYASLLTAVWSVISLLAFLMFKPREPSKGSQKPKQAKN